MICRLMLHSDHSDHLSFLQEPGFGSASENRAAYPRVWDGLKSALYSIAYCSLL